MAVGSSHDPWGWDRVHKEVAPQTDVQTLLKEHQFSQFSCVLLFVTPLTVACQACLSITNSGS